MNIFKLLVPYFITIICELNHGAYSMKHLGEWHHFVRDVRHGKNQKLDERLSTPTDATKNIRRKRSVDQTEPLPTQGCTKGRYGHSFTEKVKCPSTFCQHVSYRCDIRCQKQETEDNNCGLYNCAGIHHCPYVHTIPLQEVCDNKSQCLDSDDESACVHPCQPICMCIGLTVKFSDPFLVTARFPSNTPWNHLLSSGLQQLSKISYLVIEDKYNVYKTFSKGLQSLRSLDLSNNGIVLLPKGVFGDMSSIVHLNLSYNKINQMSIDTFYGLRVLKYLDLSNNQISVLLGSVFSGLPNLADLSLSNNQISVLPDSVFSSLPRLTHFILSNNQISVLPDSVLSSLPILRYLDLFSNQITVLPDSVFSGFPNLTNLYLPHNQISVLSDSVFSGLPILKRLDLSINQISVLPSSVFSGLPVLSYLDLSSNQITVLPDSVFSSLTVLSYLDLSSNQITVLPDSVFSSLTVLSYLDLSSNHITVLPDSVFSSLTVLSYLDLSSNQITALPDNMFNELHHLMYLSLANNQILSLSHYSFSGVFNLKDIFLNENVLSVLPMLPAAVEWLDISYNNFATLPAGTFTNSSNLSILSIIGNKLKVKQHMFEGLDNLTVLLTDTPFMCCVKPKSVADDKCLNNRITFDFCLFENSVCKSEGDVISSCKNLIGSDLLRVFLWIIGFCSLIGNFTVMFYRLLIDRDNITTSYSIFVLNLSMSDFIMGIYLMIIGSFDIHYRDVYAWNDQDWRSSIVCTIAGILSNISSEMSTFLILMVTIDRVIVIVFPMSRLYQRNISGNQAWIISLFLWLVAITVAIIPVVSMQFYFKGKYYSQSGVCLALPLTRDEQPGSGYSFAVFVCLNSFIFVIIAIGQLCMFNSLVTSGGSRVASSQTLQRDLTVARTLFLVVATDFCCWFPIGVMGVMSKSGHEIPNDVYAWVMVFVLPVNAAINPFLYTASAIWRKRQRVR